MSLSAIYEPIDTNFVDLNKMTQETKQDEKPNFEDTSDGKRIFTPKQWLERFRQYTKGIYIMYIPELKRGAEMTQNSWTDKEVEIQEEFI